MKHFSLTLFILFLIYPGLSTAKKNPLPEDWNPGVLVLKSQEILKGQIYYNVEYDLVQIKIDNQIKTFSPYNVQYFQFYDEVREIKRLYAALDEGKKQKRKGMTFFEVLLDGDMVLLRKEEMHFIPDYEILYNAIDLVPSLAYRHYVLVVDKITAFNNFQNDVLPLMADQSEGIESFILDKKLNIHDFVDQILIMDYYNFLKNPLYKILGNQILVKE